MLNEISRVYHSIFSKLLLIILLIGLLMNALGVIFFFKGRLQHNRVPLGRNIVNYMNYLIGEIGDPPSREKAVKLAAHYYYNIEFQGPAASWSTSEKQNPAAGHRTRTVYQTEDAKVVLFRGGGAIVVNKSYGRFTFTTHRYPFMEDNTFRYYFFAGILSFCLLIAYVLIRRILLPIAVLTKSVRTVGGGNLDHRVAVKSSDELGELGRAFNSMAEKIQAMLANREQLLLDVSHELRTPITRMKVALEFMPSGKARDTLGEDIVEMETMVTEILESARLRSGNSRLNPVAADLCGLIGEAARRFEHHPPGIRLVDLPETCVVQADPGLVGTVLNNICMNALKYSPKESGPVTIRLQRHSDHIAVAVRDNGPGIPAKDLPRIFEPFYRVDKSRSKRTGGYGLGLSLCKSIMDAHGGGITVESKEGEGTLVVIRFKNGPAPLST